MKKLFSNSWKALLLELAVVFIGVYLAFVLNNYSESQKVKSEREKVMVSLKHELDVIGLSFSDMSNYQTDKVKEWRALLKQQQTADFYNWRYIQPQYNYAVLEYAIDTRDARIINFALYEKLVKVYQELKKLEYAENLMTEWGGKYELTPADIDSNSVTYKMRAADNLFAFSKFIAYANDRGSVLQRLPDYAREALKLINQNFSPEQRYAMEEDLLKEFATSMGVKNNESNWEWLHDMAKNHFTDLPASRWEALKKEMISSKDIEK